MGADEKRAEIGVYDGDDDTRPAYDAYWADDHQARLLEVGPGGAFERLLDQHAADGDVLVVGCGTGATVRRLAERDGTRRVAGIEMSAKRLRAARSLCTDCENVVLARADAEELPFVDGAFDTVVAHSVLHHLPAWQTAGLDSLSRVLDDEGALVFYEPGAYNPPAVVRRRLFPSRLHTPGEAPFDPTAFRTTLERRFATVSVESHCVFSNLVPVVANVLPLGVPTTVTERAYRVEQRAMGGRLDRLGWILTGVAASPVR